MAAMSVTGGSLRLAWMVALAGIWLVGCGQRQAANAALQEVSEPATIGAAATGLPPECQQYLDRARACFAKAGGDRTAASFEVAFEQARKQWDEAKDKASLVPGCKVANQQFAQAAALLKCE